MSVTRFLGDLEQLLAHATGRLGAVGRTFSECAQLWLTSQRGGAPA
jgi:hypothetical protein